MKRDKQMEAMLNFLFTVYEVDSVDDLVCAMSEIRKVA